LDRAQKEAVVAELHDRLKGSKVAILTKFTGLNVEQATQLRRQLREVGVEYRVVKNTLLRLAAKETEAEQLTDHFFGPNGVALSAEDPVTSAKVLTKFSEEHPALEIKAALVEGQVIAPEAVKSLASLPSRDVLLGKLAGLLQALPSQLVRVLNSPLQQLAGVLQAIQQAKPDEG
jgi:large subunit ribosomal protein L10